MSEFEDGSIVDVLTFEHARNPDWNTPIVAFEQLQAFRKELKRLQKLEEGELEALREENKTLKEGMFMWQEAAKSLNTENAKLKNIIAWAYGVNRAAILNGAGAWSDTSMLGKTIAEALKEVK
jgi:FtsZ-binding cell division protein ZapB